MTDPQSMTLIQRFFAGLAEQTFEAKLGIVDPPLIDYLSDLLVRYVRMDQFHTIRSSRGHALSELGKMFEEAESRLGTARRRIHRCIGDFAMFWAGLFPESLRKARRGAELDEFGSYCLHGKRAYLIASSIPSDEANAAPGEVLARLGLEFEMCAYGLREVRREWEEAEDLPPTLL